MENIREIVNGKLLAQFTGKKVSITGLVTTIHPNGLSFEIKAVDDVMVKVLMKKPLQDHLEGYIEVHGISQGHTVACEEIIQFKECSEAEFDAAAHNSVCMLLNSAPRLWDTELDPL